MSHSLCVCHVCDSSLPFFVTRTRTVRDGVPVLEFKTTPLFFQTTQRFDKVKNRRYACADCCADGKAINPHPEQDFEPVPYLSLVEKG